jgi:glutamate racemase
LIRKEISSFYKDQVEILDSSVIVAEALRDYLSSNNLSASHTTTANHFYVSDFTEAFESSTKTFFGEQVSLERHALWS